METIEIDLLEAVLETVKDWPEEMLDALLQEILARMEPISWL